MFFVLLSSWKFLLLLLLLASERGLSSLLSSLLYAFHPSFQLYWSFLQFFFSLIIFFVILQTKPLLLLLPHWCQEKTSSTSSWSILQVIIWWTVVKKLWISQWALALDAVLTTNLSLNIFAFFRFLLRIGQSSGTQVSASHFSTPPNPLLLLLLVPLMFLIQTSLSAYDDCRIISKWIVGAAHAYTSMS